MPFSEFGGKKIFFRAEGAGNPVVLLHGFGEDGRIWDNQVKTLRERYRVFVPDLPGSGKSEMLDEPASMENFAEAMQAVILDEIQKEGNTTFSLIGHSMGGYITLAFAEKYPESLNAFGLFHSSAYSDNEEKIQTRKKGIEFIRKNGSEAFLKTSIPNLFSEKSKLDQPQLPEQLLSVSKNITPDALIGYYEAMIRRPDRTEVLKNFTRPVLFIAGVHDSAVPLPAVLEQCHLPAISTVNFLQNSGHMGMWEEPELSNDYLLSFLRFVDQ
jgi:pimeloyl-ACP methyl ester carboxylesterase